LYGQCAADGEQRRRPPRRVPGARVKEAADAGPCVLRRVLGRLPDQPGEGDERDRREHEERDAAGSCELVDEDRGGGKGERPPEELPSHSASLKSGSVGTRKAWSRRRLAPSPLSVKSCAALHPREQ